MSSPTIRLARSGDASAVADIYRPSVETTVISFEYVAPSPSEMARRIDTTTVKFPWLVLEADGAIAGYAYASRHSERAAYDWSVNCAVYVAAAHRRRGVGRALYTSLFAMLVAQGYFKAYAGITLPNAASVGLHEG